MTEHFKDISVLWCNLSTVEREVRRGREKERGEGGREGENEKERDWKGEK